MRDVPGSNERGIAEREASYLCDFVDGESSDGGEDLALETETLLFQLLRGVSGVPGFALFRSCPIRLPSFLCRFPAMSGVDVLRPQLLEGCGSCSGKG